MEGRRLKKYAAYMPFDLYAAVSILSIFSRSCRSSHFNPLAAKLTEQDLLTSYVGRHVFFYEVVDSGLLTSGQDDRPLDQRSGR